MTPRRPFWRDDAPIRVGVSSCLLGQAVRFDGGHKRDRLLTDELARFVEWVPVCPEAELGMGILREPVELRRQGAALRMLGTKSGRDWTAAMEAFSARRVKELARLELCGYVLKQDSPSCGMARVKVHGPRAARREGRGLFAAALLQAAPALPVEEEGRLHDPALCENWIERVFAYRRLRSLFATRFSVARLVAFHSAHELELLAHSPEAWRRLGRLVARARSQAPGTGTQSARFAAGLERRYQAGFMAALAVPATPHRHAHVLRHCLACFRDRLDRDTRAALAAEIADYRAGRLPLVAPLTRIRKYALRLGIDHLAGQVDLLMQTRRAVPAPGVHPSRQARPRTRPGSAHRSAGSRPFDRGSRR